MTKCKYCGQDTGLSNTDICTDCWNNAHPKEKKKEEKQMPEEVKPKEEDKVNKEIPVPEKEVEKMEEIESEEEEESEEEKKKKKSKLKAKKGEGSSQSPEEAANVSNADANTLSPGADVPSKPQNVFVPSSSVSVAREQVTPMGKSFEDSPLMKHLEGMEKAMTERLAAMEKSMNDRLANTKKELEKFYNQSFYKAAGENVAPEATQAQSISKQIADGNVRFRNK